MLFLASLDFNLKRRRSQDMTRVPEAHPDARRGIQPLLIGNVADLLEAGLGVFERIDRLQPLLAALLIAPISIVRPPIPTLPESGNMKVSRSVVLEWCR